MGSSSRGKSSKEEGRSSKRHVSSSSSEDSTSSSSSSESESESKIHFKKQKVDSATKKQRKREKKREREKKKKKETNKISKDDFYHKSTEFRLWLVEEKGKYFDQLTGVKAKNYFKKFVKRWNAGKLAKKFYRGIDHEDARASLTKYKWKFAERHTPTKKLDIASYDNRHNTARSGDHMTPVADGLMKPKTFSTFGKSATSGSTDNQIGPSRPVQGPSRPVQGPSRPVQGPMRPPSLSQAEYENTQEQKMKQLRKERKQFREHDKMVMEELVPKATGHEAKIEKRLLRAEKRQRRGNSPETRESFLYGGKTDIQSQVDAQRQKKEQRREHWENKAATKAEEYRAKEKAKMSALLELARANKSENALW